MTEFVPIGERRVTLDSFFTRFFLKSRVDCGQGETVEPVEALANVYVVGRLTNFYNRPRILVVQQETSESLYRRLACLPVPRDRANVWRQAADMRFLAQSLFWEENKTTPKDSLWSADYARFCYLAASELYKQTADKKSALPDTLYFLAQNYVQYQVAVRHLATEYLNLLTLVTDTDVEQEINAGQRIYALHDLIDLLVDWRHQPSAELRERIIAAAQILKLPLDKLPTDLRVG